MRDHRDIGKLLLELTQAGVRRDLYFMDGGGQQVCCRYGHKCIVVKLGLGNDRRKDVLRVPVEYRDETPCPTQKNCVDMKRIGGAEGSCSRVQAPNAVQARYAQTLAYIWPGARLSICCIHTFDWCSLRNEMGCPQLLDSAAHG